MEIAVLTIHNVGDQAVMKSVNRHVFFDGSLIVGWHPDFYDGVDAKNVNAENMFSGLENQLGRLNEKLSVLDEEIGQWTDLQKLAEFADKIADRFKLDRDAVFGLFSSIRFEAVKRLKVRKAELKSEIENVGVKKEHAKNYLADVQRDFPRMVEYIDQK